METKRKILVKYRNGEKIRQISREAQISRNTIRGIVRNKEQIKEGYERKVQPYPALGEYIGKLEKILRENKNTKPTPTNRHVYEEIVLQGYKGSYSTISRYIGKWNKIERSVNPAACVPLEFTAGEAYQFDWSEEYIMINDEIVKVKVAHFILCYSRKRFVRIYPNEKQEMVFDAHIKAFKYMGGSPKKGIYNNMKTAVQKVLRGKEREWNKKFEQLCAHYMVEPTACTPARGNEKGRVERQVAIDRQQFFTPMPKGKSMAEINDQLMSDFIKYNNSHKHPEYKDQTIEEMYQKEKDGLVSAPILFDGHKESYLKVSTTCLVRYDRNSYSVNCSCAGEIVECKAYADTLIFIYEGKEVGVHTRKFSKGETYYDPEHYLPLLKIKPGALRNGAPFKGLELPQELCKVRELLEEKKNGARDFAQILSYIPVESMEAVVLACKEALRGGVITKDIILNILHRRNDKEEVEDNKSEEVYRELKCALEVDLKQYDQLLSGRL